MLPGFLMFSVCTHSSLRASCPWWCFAFSLDAGLVLSTSILGRDLSLSGRDLSLFPVGAWPSVVTGRLFSCHNSRMCPLYCLAQGLWSSLFVHRSPSLCDWIDAPAPRFLKSTNIVRICLIYPIRIKVAEATWFPPCQATKVIRVFLSLRLC